MKKIFIILAMIVLCGCASADRRKFWGIESSQDIVDKHLEWSPQIKQAIHEGRLIIGMNYDQVTAAWGAHTDVNTTMTGSTRYEQVCFANRYAYFRNGILESYQESK